MSGKSATAAVELLLPSGAAKDLRRSDCMRLVIERAFPLPATGAFTDLLAAIDSPLAHSKKGGIEPKSASKAIHFGGTVNPIFTIRT